MAALAGSVRAMVACVSGAAAGVSMLDWSYGGELLADGVYVLDGEWNVCCVALDGISGIVHHLPTALVGTVLSTIRQAIADLGVISSDAPISTPARPCVLFAHQLPDSLLSVPYPTFRPLPPTQPVHRLSLSVYWCTPSTYLRHRTWNSHHCVSLSFPSSSAVT